MSNDPKPEPQTERTIDRAFALSCTYLYTKSRATDNLPTKEFPMRNVSRIIVLALIGAMLGACGGGGSADNGTPQAPSNALKISIAYSPEKDGWLKDRIA